MPEFEMDMQSVLMLVLVLLTAFPLHGLAHAWVADRLGDDTPERNGCLTFHPAAHLDIWGSLALLLFGFGWGRPVPITRSHFKRPRLYTVLSSLAGPLTNVLLAFIAILVSQMILALQSRPDYTIPQLFEIYAWTNLTLALFNLIPIPPLDGGDIFGAFLPRKVTNYLYDHYYGCCLVLAVLMMTGLIGLPLSLGASAIFRGLEGVAHSIAMLFT